MRTPLTLLIRQLKLCMFHQRDKAQCRHYHRHLRNSQVTSIFCNESLSVLQLDLNNYKMNCCGIREEKCSIRRWCIILTDFFWRSPERLTLRFQVKCLNNYCPACHMAQTLTEHSNKTHKGQLYSIKTTTQLVSDAEQDKYRLVA